MTTVVKTIGADPSRDYASIQAFFAAGDSVDFSGTSTEWYGELYDDDGEGFLLTASEAIELDNQNTSATWGRRLRPATGHEWKPYAGTGVRIRKVLDSGSTDDHFLAIKREVGFRIDGSIGLFLDGDGQPGGTAVYYGLRIAGTDVSIDGLFVAWVRTGYSNYDSVLAIRVEEDTGHSGSPAAQRVSLVNVTVAGLGKDEREGFHRGIDIEADANIEDVHVQNCAVYGCGAQSSSIGVNYGTIGGTFLRVLNTVSIDNASADFFGAGATVLGGNVSSDETGYPGGAFDPGVDPKAFPSEAWVDHEAFDFRPRFNSPAMGAGLGAVSMAVYAETVDTDVEGLPRDGATWDAGPFEGGTVPVTQQPTLVETSVGFGNVHESLETWERGSRGNLVGQNERRRGNVTAFDTGEEVLFDNDVEDEPEKLWTGGGWALTAGGSTETGDAQASSVASPYGFGLMFDLESTSGASTEIGIVSTAGTFAASGEWNHVVFSVAKGTGDSFRINFRNVTDAVSHWMDFDWSAGVPVLDSSEGGATFSTPIIRGPFTVTGGEVFHIKVAYQSQAGDVGDARSIFFYNVKPSAGSFASMSTTFGFVRVASRTDSRELPYSLGEVPTYGAYWTAADPARRRELIAATRYDPDTGRGVSVTRTSAGAAMRIVEPYYTVRGLLAESGHGSDVDRFGFDIAARGVTVDACVGRILTGAAATNEAACFRLGSSATDALVSNSIALGSGGALGARRGFDAQAGSSGRVANAVAYEITGGSDGTGFLRDASSTVIFSNDIATDCDTDFSVAAVAQEASISSDSTADGPKSQTGEAATDLFVDAAGGNFKLPSTSAALNAGVNLQTFFALDFAGASRTAPWECGAFDGIVFAPLVVAEPLGTTNHLARIYEILRTDGEALRYTDANEPIPHAGQVYGPLKGVSRSAVRREAGLRESNAEIVGVLSSDEITDIDLRAGRYRGAIIRERLISWLFPFAAPIYDREWIVHNTTWTGELWQADIAARSVLLQRRVGEVTSRTCRYKLGDPTTCKANIESDTQVGAVVTSVTNARKTFSASAVSASYADDYFAWGSIVWQTGENAGIEGVVKSYTQATRTVELQNRLPFDVQTGDTFRMEPGCDRLLSTCTNKFLNEINFGAEPYTPGTDKALQTPTA